MPRPSHHDAGIDRTRRLQHDHGLLAAHEPQLRHVIKDAQQVAQAIGPLTLELPDGSPEPIDVRIEFGPSYPSRPPRAYDHGARWAPELDRHIERNGRFCLFLPGVNEPDLKPDDSLLQYLADLRTFLRQQLTFDSQRRHNPQARFPGPEWPHGARGAYAIFVVETLASPTAPVRESLWTAATEDRTLRATACPCGSNTAVEDCHHQVLKDLRRALWEAPTLAELTFNQLLAFARENCMDNNGPAT